MRLDHPKVSYVDFVAPILGPQIRLVDVIGAIEQATPVRYALSYITQAGETSLGSFTQIDGWPNGKSPKFEITFPKFQVSAVRIWRQHKFNCCQSWIPLDLILCAGRKFITWTDSGCSTEELADQSFIAVSPTPFSAFWSDSLERGSKPIELELQSSHVKEVEIKLKDEKVFKDFEVIPHTENRNAILRFNRSPKMDGTIFYLGSQAPGSWKFMRVVTIEHGKGESVFWTSDGTNPTRVNGLPVKQQTLAFNSLSLQTLNFRSYSDNRAPSPIVSVTLRPEISEHPVCCC